MMNIGDQTREKLQVLSMMLNNFDADCRYGLSKTNSKVRQINYACIFLLHYYYLFNFIYLFFRFDLKCI